MIHPAAIFFSPAHPLFSIFKFEFIETKPDFLAIKFIALERFVDRVDTNHLHSGFCTLILDSVMGGSVMGSLEKMQPIATINLTTQHSSRAMLDDYLICSANVECIEDQIAIVTGQVTRDENGEILANAVGSFMIGTRATPLVSTAGAN
ncbi:MAG: PaaI family thioesterase [Hyphomicrobiales bacterium]|nr:PaaI family thioesterase [Hyphomicrobiales bacterium]